MIKSGELKHRIQIYSPPTGIDSRGRSTGDWNKVAEVNAHLKTLSGDEAVLARQLVSRATHQIKLRYQRKFTLSPKHEIRFRGRRFSIGHVENVEEENVEWIATAIEDVN